MFKGDAYLDNGLKPDNVANEKGRSPPFFLVCCFFAVLTEVQSESVPNWI